MRKKAQKVISAPGRICLFGEHSDYLGLPVITMAINKRLTISAFPRRDKRFRILMPDLKEEDQFVPSQPIRYKKPRDYLRAGVNVLKRGGYRFPKGYDFLIKSHIPITAGTSSSSALVVAWIRMLLSLSPYFSQFNPLEIARLAYETEVLEFREPGGRMDHFAIAFGEFIYHENHETIDIRHFKQLLTGMVLGDSLEKKETLRDLKQNRRDVTAGFKRMKKALRSFDVERTPVEDILKKISIDTIPLKKAMATLRNRDITHAALKEFMIRPSHQKRVGRLMNQHHAQLKRYLKISTPKIERMIAAARRAGALGAKINGSGLGGTMIAFAPGREEKVVQAIQKAGGRAWVVHQDRGVVS